jgi:hypothetical protein
MLQQLLKMSKKIEEHNARFVEMNSLLQHGEPTPGNMKRMKELYHSINARNLSPPNKEKFMQVADYLKRRENGMSHAHAYTSSMLRKKEKEMQHLPGTKASKRATITRLKDKALVPQMEAMLKAHLAEAEAMGIPKELFQAIMNDTMKGMGFRPEFNQSLKKAGFISELPKTGGGAGSEILGDSPEINHIVEQATLKNMFGGALEGPPE